MSENDDRQFTRDEERRVQELTGFCIARLQKNREPCFFLAVLRIGEEGEKPRELERLVIDRSASSEQLHGEMHTFAVEAFKAIREDARSYSDVQHYHVIALDAEGKTITSMQLSITPIAAEGNNPDAPTDRGERRQLMRHTEEAWRSSERMAARIADENKRLCDNSVARESQLITFADQFAKLMIEMGTLERERAKMDLEVRRQERKDARLDMAVKLLAPAIAQKLGFALPPGQQQGAFPPPNNNPVGQGSQKSEHPLLKLLLSLTPTQQQALFETLTEEQRADLKAAFDLAMSERDKPAPEQPHTSTNGATQ